MDTKLAQALHALVYISESIQSTTSQALAQSIGTNPSHVRKLAGLLKRAGLVRSSQGKPGFVLARPKETITLADVYAAVYPDKRLFYLHKDPHPECPVGQHIGAALSSTFESIEYQLTDALSAHTLDSVIQSLYRDAHTSK